MKFIEIELPRNAEHSKLPNELTINLDNVLEIYVRGLRSNEEDFRDYEYGLFIINQKEGLRVHGTKEECEQGYKQILSLLNSPSEGLVGKFVFPPTKSSF